MPEPKGREIEYENFWAAVRKNAETGVETLDLFSRSADFEDALHKAHLLDAVDPQGADENPVSRVEWVVARYIYKKEEDESGKQ